MASAFPIVLMDREFFYYRVHDGQEFQNTYSYVCYNYKYLSDALQMPGFPLSNEQKSFILQKARRSFIQLFISYIKETGQVVKAIRAVRISGLGWKGFLKGIVNK